MTSSRLPYARVMTSLQPSYTQTCTGCHARARRPCMGRPSRAPWWVWSACSARGATPTSPRPRRFVFHTHTHTHTHTELSLSHTHSKLSLSHIHTLRALSLSPTHTHTRTHTLRALSLSHTLSLSPSEQDVSVDHKGRMTENRRIAAYGEVCPSLCHSLCLSLWLSLCLSHTLTLSLSP